MKIVQVTPNGVSVVEETGVDAAGKPTFQSWSCNGAQGAKHLDTWDRAENRPAGIIGAKISAGDASAIRDQANEYLKQAES